MRHCGITIVIKGKTGQCREGMCDPLVRIFLHHQNSDCLQSETLPTCSYIEAGEFSFKCRTAAQTQLNVAVQDLSSVLEITQTPLQN